MAAPVGPQFLRLLRGVAPWRSRYGCLGRRPGAGAGDGPKPGHERGTVLPRARPEEGSVGTGPPTATCAAGAAAVASGGLD